jgi:preprotein translocase subunit SecF
MRFEGLRRVAKGQSNIDFIGRARTWFTISAVVLLASILGLTIRQFNLGLEFKGGTSFTVPLTNDATVADVRDAIAPFNLGEAAVQISTERTTNERRATVRVEHIAQRAELTQVQTALARVGGQLDSSGQPLVDAVSVDDVGPNWGKQVSNKALRGLIVFLVLVVIYITLRFELKMAAAALAALFHDLIATAGIYALVGLTVTPATVIALLTLLGYSLYDTVVVFDRIRENTETLTSASKISYSDMVNRSVNQVLMRSLNTSLTSLLPVGALLFVGAFLLGAETLEDLALALFVGILVGTYSSIFVASPILALWKEREPRYKQMRVRLGDRVSPAIATAGASMPSRAMRSRREEMPIREEPDSTEPSRVDAPGPQIRTGIRPPPRGRQRRGGKRRR